MRGGGGGVGGWGGGGGGAGTPSPASSKLAALITSSELECWNGTMHHREERGNRLISPLPPCGAP